MYASELPDESQGLFDSIKDTSEEFKWSGLSWRAVIPLYLQQYSTDIIKGMVELPPSTPTEMSQRVRGEGFRLSKTVSSVEDIILFYEAMANPASPDETTLSGRKKMDIAESLAAGDYIPAEGYGEELEIEQHGRKRVISFDHLYFRLENTKEGVDWDEAYEKSQDITLNAQPV